MSIASIPMKLLVVEDEPRLLRSLAGALRDEGYAVDTAVDGSEGLYKALTTNYDAIVLDVMLPGVDGWEILRRVRQTHKTPVLMLTARDGTADRVKGLDAGAQGGQAWGWRSAKRSSQRMAEASGWSFCTPIFLPSPFSVFARSTGCDSRLRNYPTQTRAKSHSSSTT